MGEETHGRSAGNPRPDRSGSGPDLRVGATTYRAQCYSCAYSRKFGAAELSARLAADKHGRAHVAHIVGVTQEKIVQLKMAAQPQLFRTDDVPY